MGDGEKRTALQRKENNTLWKRHEAAVCSEVAEAKA